jgi:hypothetical protein
MTMERLAILLGMLGCGAAMSHVAPGAPVANAKPAVKRPAVALTAEWPSQSDSGDIVARTPAGQFVSLPAVCAALGRKESNDKFEGCHWAEYDELRRGPFLRTGNVTTWEPVEHDDDVPVRLEYFALQTGTGWYVLPRLGDTGNRYSSLFVQAERAGSGLLLHYTYDLATGGRFSSTIEEGVVACEVVGTVACTPKIAAHSYHSRIDTSKPDWPTETDVLSACTASYASHSITIAPMRRPEGNDGTWTAEAAARCRGTRAVRY